MGSVDDAPSALKQNIATRKERKTRKNKKIYWADVHGFISDLKTLLIEYSNIGIAATQHYQHVPDETKAEYIKNAQLLLSDINVFNKRLLALQQSIRSADEVVSINDLGDYYSAYEQVDAIRVDLSTVLTATASYLSEVILSSLPPENV